MHQAIATGLLKIRKFPDDRSLLLAFPLEHRSQGGVIAGKGHNPVHRLNQTLTIALAGVFREPDHRLPLGQQR